MTKQEAINKAFWLSRSKGIKFDVVREVNSKPDNYYAVVAGSKEDDPRFELIAISD